MVAVLLVIQSGCLGMITSWVRQRGETQEAKGCFNVGEAVGMDVHGDKPTHGHVGWL